MGNLASGIFYILGNMVSDVAEFIMINDYEFKAIPQKIRSTHGEQCNNYHWHCSTTIVNLCYNVMGDNPEVFIVPYKTQVWHNSYP